MKEQMILEDILGEIGRTNNLSNFPTKLSFEEANIRLVNYNKATKQKEEKVGARSDSLQLVVIFITSIFFFIEFLRYQKMVKNVLKNKKWRP